jgi:hypothetical protein
MSRSVPPRRAGTGVIAAPAEAPSGACAAAAILRRRSWSSSCWLVVVRWPLCRRGFDPRWADRAPVAGLVARVPLACAVPTALPLADPVD